ncbi:MAG: ankyrin repeat domain-containing protein [Chloroflexi bacterium]|nr:ankyrin repeat domain-containing protein [Chloroflexota bacterium]
MRCRQRMGRRWYIGAAIVCILALAGYLRVMASRREGVSALEWAVDSRDLHRVMVLLSQGADPNVVSVTSLGDDEVAYYEVNPCVQEIYGGPLVSAASSGQTRIAEVLLDYGADVNAVGRTMSEGYGEDSFLSAPSIAWVACNGDAATFKLLLAHHADIYRRDPCGETPLQVAQVFGSKVGVRMLRDAGARY